MANGVGELDFATGGQSGGHDVFGNVAAHVGGAAVNLGRILAAESATAVTAHAAVAINDDFAASETGVALRSADDETTGWVDEVNGLLVEHLNRQDFLDHFFDNKIANLAVLHVSAVLSGNDDVCDTNRLAVLVLDRDLALGVGAEPLDAASFAQARQLASKTMRKHDR